VSLESIYKLQNGDTFADNPNLKTIENKLKEWTTIVEDLFISQIQKIIRIENKNVFINRDSLSKIVSQNTFFDANTKIIETLENLFSEITKTLIEVLKTTDSLVKKQNEGIISLVNQESFYDVETNDDDHLNHQKIEQIIKNFEILLETQRDLNESIRKNISFSALKNNREASRQSEESLIQAFTDSLFSFIRNNKQFIEENLSTLESKSSKNFR